MFNIKRTCSLCSLFYLGLIAINSFLIKHFLMIFRILLLMFTGYSCLFMVSWIYILSLHDYMCDDIESCRPSLHVHLLYAYSMYPGLFVCTSCMELFVVLSVRRVICSLCYLLCHVYVIVIITTSRWHGHMSIVTSLHLHHLLDL